MIKRRYVATRTVQKGMIIDQLIMDRAGRILIARGTQLDEYLISSLTKMGIPGIYIKEGEEEEEKKPDQKDPVIAPAVEKKIETLKV